ncbi:MAG TPA: STAS domain-containing protein [Thermoleophilia bacterium]|nr:STAS domain-containing protein [Thermoleophilia bacterium]
MSAQPRDRAETAYRATSLRGGSGGLRLSFAGAGDVPVLALSGEFDLENVPEIERFLRRHLGPFFFKTRHLVLDLAGVDMVDSSFVGAVVSLVVRLHEHRRELLITRPVGYVRRTIALVGLPNVVPVYETLEAALLALAAGGPLIPPPFSLGPLTSPETRYAPVAAGTHPLA